jgi:hypothetical protein
MFSEFYDDFKILKFYDDFEHIEIKKKNIVLTALVCCDR